MLTPAQLEERKGGLGGSDAPIVAGISTFKTPLELYFEKRGELEPQDLSDNQAVHFGNVLEDVIANEYTERTGRRVRRVNKTKHHPQYPWMLANLDRDVVIHPKRLLECKTTGFSAGWGEEGTAEIPESHLLQCQHYLEVTGKEIADVAVLIGGRDFRLYHVERDDELIKLLIDIEQKFWDKVQAGVQPEMDFTHQTTAELIKRMYPGTNGQTIELPQDALSWHNTLLAAKKHIKDYKGVVDGAESHLKSLMGEAAVGKFTDGSGYTRKEVRVKESIRQASSYIKFSFKGKVGK
jgi:putative phage-type endonuclease